MSAPLASTRRNSDGRFEHIALCLLPEVQQTDRQVKAL